MIAHHHGLESSLEPHQRLGRVRAAVDQIADPEEAVGIGVKAKLRQRAVQGAKSSRGRRQRQDRARADWRGQCGSRPRCMVGVLTRGASPNSGASAGHGVR